MVVKLRTWAPAWVCLSLCLVAAGCGPAAAPPAARPATEAAAVEPPAPALTAQHVLQAMSRSYAAMQSVRVDIVETMSLDRAGSRDSQGDRAAALVARPNRLSLPGSSLSFHADGRQLWTVLGDRYSCEPCPASLAQIADDPVRNSLLEMGSLFLLRLLSDDAAEAITREVESMVVLDDVLLDQRLTHHLQFVEADVDWEMWVSVDEPRLIRQIVVDLSRQLGGGLADSGAARITTTIRFENWQIDPSLDAESFAYRPADGARQVEHVMQVGR